MQMEPIQWKFLCRPNWTCNQAFKFEAMAYEQNGSIIDVATVSWELVPDFDGNYSRLASLSNPVGQVQTITLFNAQEGKSR